MRGIVQDLHVQYGGQPAQALRPYAQVVDAIEYLQAQFLDAVLRPARAQVLYVYGLQQGFLGQEHGLLGGAAYAQSQYSWRAPAGAHAGYGLDYPVHDAVGGIQHGETGFRLRAAALGGDMHAHLVPRHRLHMYNRRRVVAGIPAAAGGVIEYGCAQYVIGMGIGAVHAFVDHVGDAHAGLPLHIHSYADEHRDDAGVLADGTMALGAKAGINQDLRQRIPGSL